MKRFILAILLLITFIARVQAADWQEVYRDNSKIYYVDKESLVFEEKITFSWEKYQCLQAFKKQKEKECQKYNRALNSIPPPKKSDIKPVLPKKKKLTDIYIEPIPQNYSSPWEAELADLVNIPSSGGNPDSCTICNTVAEHRSYSCELRAFYDNSKSEPEFEPINPDDIVRVKYYNFICGESNKRNTIKIFSIVMIGLIALAIVFFIMKSVFKHFNICKL